MLDGLSLDQLRMFVAAVDTGSFSAAARSVGRAQSVISQALATLEARLGVALFDRTGRIPVLTEAGRAMLGEARAVLEGADRLKARAASLAGGLEAELSIVVDVLFPIELLTASVAAFRLAFPETQLRLEVEALGAVLPPVLEGRCAFCIMGSLPARRPDFTRERLLGVRLVRVVSPLHPLARVDGPIPGAILAEHVQLVLTDRSTLSAGQDFGVVSPRIWRLGDLGAKHAFLRAGLGWGAMPLGLVASDVQRGTLIVIAAEDEPPYYTMSMWAAWPTQAPPGPAGRWLIARLQAAGRHAGDEA